MKNKNSVRQTRFPNSLFWIVLSVLLITGGVHQGLIIGLDRSGWDPIIQVHIVLVYWFAVASGLAYIIVRVVRRTYDKPLRQITEATKRISEGDFSVRISPTHTGDQIDFLDVMADDINTMTKELGSIETLKADFISNVSHELKTPLAIINNYGTLLGADVISDEERKEYARSVTDASRRMSELISNILRMNRLENQQLDAKRESFDLSVQLGECLLQYESIWDDKQIELQVDIADDVIVESDPELLGLVWNNLLSNAFKFTESGGLVSVTLSYDDDFAVVEVKDSGCGMDEETIKRIFDKFYQGDTSHAMQGNGLGLALVKRVIDIVDGEINVNSVLGEGSTFTVKVRRNLNERI